MVDGNWVSKLRAGTEQRRNPADQYGGTDIKEISRRKKLFGGEKEQLLQVTVNVGTFLTLLVSAEARDKVDQLVAELQRARDAAAS